MHTNIELCTNVCLYVALIRFRPKKATLRYRKNCRKFSYYIMYFLNLFFFFCYICCWFLSSIAWSCIIVVGVGVDLAGWLAMRFALPLFRRDFCSSYGCYCIFWQSNSMVFFCFGVCLFRLVYVWCKLTKRDFVYPSPFTFFSLSLVPANNTIARQTNPTATEGA